MVSGYVEGLEDSVKNRFKGKKGTNTIDWICNALGQQKTSALHKCPDCGSETKIEVHPDDAEVGARYYCPKCTKKHNKWPSVNGVGDAPHWPSWSKKDSKFTFKAKFLQK